MELLQILYLHVKMLKCYVFGIVVKEGEIAETDQISRIKRRKGEIIEKKQRKKSQVKGRSSTRSKREKRDSVSAKEMITLIL